MFIISLCEVRKWSVSPFSYFRFLVSNSHIQPHNIQLLMIIIIDIHIYLAILVRFLLLSVCTDSNNDNNKIILLMMMIIIIIMLIINI